MTTERSDAAIKEAVGQRYSAIAQRQLGDVPLVDPAEGASCCGDGECGDEAQIDAVKAWYDAADTGALPRSVTDAALGCGNPTAIAELSPGEVVLDLGSGGGIDCFLAAAAVGPSGRAIGVDMTDEMLALARGNAKKVGATNVEFRKGEIEALPVADGSVDVIISNCVINLSTDKDHTLREAYRVLKPGGRFRVSDIVLTRPLDVDEARYLSEWAGCIAGALEHEDYETKLRAAGFTDVEVGLQDAWRDGVHSAEIRARKPD